MALSIYGLRSHEDDREVRYEVRSMPGDTPEGVLVIPKDAPEEWTVEPEPARPLAGRIYVKAVRRFREENAWPRAVSHQS